MNRIDLEGRVAVITGGSGGIGLATAQRMLASGARVELWDRDERALGQALERVPEASVAGVDVTPTPALKPATVERDYDLFFFLCQSPPDLEDLAALRGWRERCRFAVCWIEELWVKWIREWPAALEPLKRFDMVFVGLQQSVPELEKAIGRPCRHILPGVDALRFCPFPLMPRRRISTTGARPEPSLRFEPGQCIALTPRSAITPCSASVTQTQCAAQRRGLARPTAARYSTFVWPPDSRRTTSTSSRDSDACV